jgi:UDP-glucose 4-epimerase
LAERVIERTGSSSEIKFVPYQNVYGDGFEDMRRRVPCLQKVYRLIGWHPLRSMNDIIDDVIAGMEARQLLCQ